MVRARRDYSIELGGIRTTGGYYLLDMDGIIALN